MTKLELRDVEFDDANVRISGWVFVANVHVGYVSVTEDGRINADRNWLKDRPVGQTAAGFAHAIGDVLTLLAQFLRECESFEHAGWTLAALESYTLRETPPPVLVIPIGVPPEREWFEHQRDIADLCERDDVSWAFGVG